MWDLFIHFLIIKLSICLLQVILAIPNNNDRALVSIFNDNTWVVFQTVQSLSFFLCKMVLVGISMSSNLFPKQLRYVSMITSLFRGLKEHLGQNLSAVKDCTSFLKCHIGHTFLPYSSNSVFNFPRFFLLAVSTNFKPLDSSETSEAERLLLEIFITFLFTSLSSKLSPVFEAMLFLLKTLPSFSQL